MTLAFASKTTLRTDEGKYGMIHTTRIVWSMQASGKGVEQRINDAEIGLHDRKGTLCT